MSAVTAARASAESKGVGTVPELQAGDHLTRAEFERRYEAMPHLKKAELIEGVVYIPSPVRLKKHSQPHAWLGGWLFEYEAGTHGVEGANNATVRLDLENEPQPDLFLRILPACGGQSRDTEDDYVDGAPELVVEITASTASYDLHEKLRAYRRNGVREYLVWRTLDDEVDWFALRDERYERLAPDTQGVLESAVFPGLRLDVPALLRGDLARVLEVVREGLASPSHAELVTRLSASR